MANKSCPRCGSTKTVEFEYTFECLKCQLEFRKSNSSKIAKEDVLSIQEMNAILKELGVDEDEEKLRRLNEMLNTNDESSKEK